MTDTNDEQGRNEFENVTSGASESDNNGPVQLGISEILRTSYFSCTARDLLDLCLNLVNENVRSNDQTPGYAEHEKSRSAKDIMEKLDKNAENILGDLDWKGKLSEQFGDLTHYQEFLAFTKGGCLQVGKLHDLNSKCRECRQDRSYKQAKPSNLMRLIRNVHEHAVEKMTCNPNGVIKKELFPNGYSNKQAFVEYWLGKFPKLFHFVAALEQNQENIFDWSIECVADQAVDKLRCALDMEKNRGHLVKSYICKLSDGKQFKLELLEVLMLDPEHPKRRRLDVNKLVKVEDSSLIVTVRASEPQSSIQYQLTPFKRERFNLVIGTDLLNQESCENTENVLLLIESSEVIEEVERRLSKFTIFTLEADLEGYVDRWLIKTVEDVDEFTQQSDTVYVFLNDQRNDNFDFTGPKKQWPFFKNAIEFDHKVSAADLQALETLQSNVIVFEGHISTYENIYNSFKNLCGDRTLQLLQHRKADESNASQLTFLIPERDLTSRKNDKLVFISAGAGEGKTALLKHLLFRSDSPEMKVLHTTARKLLAGRLEPFMEAIKSCVTPLEFEVDDNILLLIDAMDETEIETESIQHLKKLIQEKELANLPKFKIIVSMRSYLENKIRDEFPTSKILKLAALADEDKKTIILNYWKPMFSDMAIKGVEDAATRIVGIYADHFELTPLHCRLLAEIYVEQVKEASAFSSEYSVREIYKNIVLKNFDRYFLEKKKFDKNQGHDVYERLKEEYEFAHVYLALKQLCPQHADFMKEALKHPKVVLTPGQGFLYNIDPPVFTHHTFAEYFVECWAVQVLLGRQKLCEKELHHFSEFFMTRYLHGEETRFLTAMLEEHKGPICFPFKLHDLDIFQLEAMCTENLSPTLTRLIVKSLAVECRHMLTKVFGEQGHGEVQGQLFPESGTKIPVTSSLLIASIEFGHYDMLHLLMELNTPFPIYNLSSKKLALVEDNHRKFPHILYSVLMNTRDDPRLLISEKKRMIEYLVTRHLSSEPYSPVDGESPTVPKRVAFELFQYLIERIKKEIDLRSGLDGQKVLDDILLQKNSRRENILHANYDDIRLLDGLRKQARQQFYKAANSIDREGKTYWMKGIKRAIKFPAEVDFCVKRFNGDPGPTNKQTLSSQLSLKSCNGSSLLQFLGSGGKNGMDQVSFWLRRANLVGDRVSEKIRTGSFDCLLAAYKACAEHEPLDQEQIEGVVHSFPACPDELSPYYVALYISNRLRDASNAQNDEFQDFLIDNVLATDGVKFKNSMCCHLLNDLIADILNDDLNFQLSEKHVQAMCRNDSSFIVACKTANVNIAKLLARSFKVNWLSDLDDFQLMCVFRALDQQCGDLLEEVVAKMADQRVPIPINTVQEVLITGNLKLFKMYVEQLRFTEVRENFPLITKNSACDPSLIKKRKKDLIKYIREELSEIMKTMGRNLEDSDGVWDVTNSYDSGNTDSDNSDIEYDDSGSSDRDFTDIEFDESDNIGNDNSDIDYNFSDNSDSDNNDSDNSDIDYNYSDNSVSENYGSDNIDSDNNDSNDNDLENNDSDDDDSYNDYIDSDDSDC